MILISVGQNSSLPSSGRRGGRSWNSAMCHGDLLQLVNTYPSGVKAEMKERDVRMQKPLEMSWESNSEPCLVFFYLFRKWECTLQVEQREKLKRKHNILAQFSDLFHGAWWPQPRSSSAHPIRPVCSHGESPRPLSLPLMHREAAFWCPRLLLVVSHESIKTDC